ncbi:MAG: hypothetical protein H6R21_3064 [Proteobacteria bacterium]|nr:hypothetical protein [Pseudomonadota bacterium]
MITTHRNAGRVSRANLSGHELIWRVIRALRWVALCSLLTLTACSRGTDAQAPAFDFQRLNTDGAPYTGNGDFATQPWSCVADRHYGLTWEVKTTQAGLRNKDNTYTWYNPDKLHNGGDAGTPDGGKCSGSACDTKAYVEAVNSQGLCGAKDWRVPTQSELSTINDPRIAHPGPTLDTRFFPEAHAAQYWAGVAYGSHYAGAWAWSFDYGYDRVDWKKTPKYLRLVRGKLAIQVKDPDD